MRILITGSSGTIGSRLSETISSKADIINLDIRPNKWLTNGNHSTTFVDLRNPEELDSLPDDIDLVVHLAANARVYELVKEPSMAHDNTTMTFNMLEFMRIRGIKKIIFASSRETYGNIMNYNPIAETEVRLENCESPYSASKMAGEALIHSYSRVYGIGFVIIRFSNVYGMYDDSDRVIPLWIRECLQNNDLVVFGKDKSLDFTYIDDAVDAVIRIIDRFDEVRGNTFNIAYGMEIPLARIAVQIKELTMASSNIEMSNNRPGEVCKYQADISKSKKLLGLNPCTDINEGLVKAIDWYKKACNGGRIK